MGAAHESDYEAGAVVLAHADADALPAAVAGLVDCALRSAPVEQYGGPTTGDKQVVALLHLATAIGGAEGGGVLARAATCADDGRVLAAVAYRAEPPLPEHHHSDESPLSR